MPDLARISAIREDVVQCAQECKARGLQIELEEIADGELQGFIRATVSDPATGESHEHVSGDPAKVIDRAMGAFKRKRGA